MDWLGELNGLVQQYAGGGKPPDEQVEQHFDAAAQNASQADLANSISKAFHSDQTPPFASMVSQLFAQSNNAQRAGLLNQLIGTVGSGALGGLLGGGALSGLGQLLSHGGQVSPEVAAQVPPEAVENIARQAEQHDPSIVDRVSGFYAQHPTLVKALGAAAMWIAVNHLSKQSR